MGLPSIVSAFAAAAQGRLRHDHIALVYRDSHQVLTVTGWHADGTPFTFVSAPFDHNPVERAGQAARDLVQAHSGSVGAPPSPQPARGPAAASLPSTAGPHLLRRSSPMSQKGSGLARLMGGLRSLDQDADALASRLEAAMGALTGEMATTQQIVGNVEGSVKDLQAVNALYSNGGQAGGNSSGSSGS